MNRSTKDTPELEIFIRDIWLSWYVNGVNKELDSLDALISYLKEVTKGYVVTTVGVSSGGYVAGIVAAKLGAIRCFDFSGQFSLIHHFNHVTNNPFLKKYYAEHPDGGNLEAWQLIKNSDTCIYYFLPTGSAQDIEQAEFAKKCDNVKCIRFSSKRHGSPVLSISLPELLSWDNNRLDKLCDESQMHELDTVAFSMKVSGVLKTLVFLGKKSVRIGKKKLTRFASKG